MHAPGRPAGMCQRVESIALAVSHGVGCGSEIPASYSNVAGAMCWIDYVMSTVINSAI